MSKPKEDKKKPLLSFTVAKMQLLTMMERCSKTGVDKILVTTITSGDQDERGTLMLTAAGHPLSVVSRAWSGDKEQGSVLIHHPGQCVLNLKDFKSIVSAMPDDLLDIVCSQTMRLVVEAAGHSDKPKRRTFTVHSLPASDYPPVPQMPAEGLVRTLEGKLVAAAIDRVRYGADDADPGDAFSGVMLELEKDHLVAVGTSGRVVGRVALKASFAEPGQLLIPRPMLGLVTELGTQCESIAIAEDQQRIYIDTEQTMATCLKSVGGYPPWRQIVNAAMQSAETVCQLDGPQLGEALGALMTVWRLSYMGGQDEEEEKKIRAVIRIELKGNTISLSTGYEPIQGAQLASSQEEIDVNNPNGHHIVLYIAPHLMRQGALQARGAVNLICDPRDPTPMLVALESLDKSFWAGTCPMRPPEEELQKKPDPPKE